jgi:hypothetical protein
MSIHFQINIDGETADDAIAEFRKVFGALSAPVGVVAAGPLVTAEATGAAPKDGEVIQPKKTRKSKADKEAESTAPLADASSAGMTESASTSSTAESSDTSASTASSEDVPDLDTVRTKLKKLGATDGLGHDKVFEVLGKYGAQNASTVPEDKRAAVIAEIDELLAGTK